MKVISSIVDNNYIMYGIELEIDSKGSEKNTKKIITLDKLINKRFKNNQIECKKSGIKELNNFKLNKLPMKLFDGEKYIKIKNELFLIKRLLVKGKLEGFLVDIGGIQKRFSTQEIINLSTWYYPINFYIRSRNNKVFISGRKGLSIKKLPAEELSTCSKINKKETLNTAFNKKDISNVVFYKDFDVITLYNIIRDLKGMILKLPTETYKKSKIPKKKYDEEFIELGMGEIGSPYIAYGEKKLNVNSRFKKPGNVLINFNKKLYTVPTYTITSKHIFLNGRNYMKKFGIIIENEKVPMLKDRFSKSLSLNQITDTTILTPIRSFLGSKSLQIITVDTGRLDIINHNRLKDFTLSNCEILENIKNLNDIKVKKRYYNFCIKETLSNLKLMGIRINPEKFGIYKGMSDDLLLAMSDAGINIYTGRYERQKNIPENKGKYEDNDYEVIYSIKGYQSIPSARDIYTKSKKAEKYISNSFSKNIDYFNKMKDDEYKIEKIKNMLKILDKEQSQIIENLWMHKIACFASGKYKTFKVFDKEKWFPVIKSNKNDLIKSFICNDVGCEKLLLKLKGLDIS